MFRRDFIKRALLILGGIFFLGPRRLWSRTDSMVFDLGPLKDYPSGTVKYLKFRDAHLVSDREGVYAISSICTHQGGFLVEREGLFHCPRHRSLFNLEGKSIRGPARDPLPWLRLELTPDKRLLLHRRFRGIKGKKIPHQTPLAPRVKD